MDSSMSDPVSNAEIEDVLSSIRRLVSNDDRSAQGDARPDTGQETPPAPPAPDNGRPAAAEALVLTPALRVSGADTRARQHDEDEARARSQEPAPQDDRQAATPAHDEHEARDEDSARQTEDETGARDDIDEANDASPEPEARAADSEADTGTDTGADTDTGTETGTEIGTETGADDEAGQEQGDPWQDDAERESAEALSERVAGFEAAVAARDDAWDPDGNNLNDDNAAAPTEPFSWQDGIEDAELVPPDEGLEPYVAEDDEVSADTAAQKAASGPEPDPAAENGFLADEDLLGDDDATVLDEDALRDLVTEIVRQELQGSLGERITRNVRKLVRREIHRALATKELE